MRSCLFSAQDMRMGDRRYRINTSRPSKRQTKIIIEGSVRSVVITSQKWPKHEFAEEKSISQDVGDNYTKEKALKVEDWLLKFTTGQVINR